LFVHERKREFDVFGLKECLGKSDASECSGSNSMENKVMYGLVLLTFFLFSCAHAIAIDLSFFLRLRNNRIELVAENHSGETKFVPWLKRGGAAFILVTEDGELLADKKWELISVYSYSRGFNFICSVSQNRSLATLSRIPVDFSNFLIPEEIRNSKESVLYLMVLINNSKKARKPMYQTPFYILRFSKTVDSLQEVDRGSIPKAVITTFQREEEKIISEEKNPNYGHW